MYKAREIQKFEPLSPHTLFIQELRIKRKVYSKKAKINNTTLRQRKIEK